MVYVVGKVRCRGERGMKQGAAGDQSFAFSLQLFYCDVNMNAKTVSPLWANNKDRFSGPIENITLAPRKGSKIKPRAENH